MGKNSLQFFRINLILIFFFVFGGIILARIVYLQFFSNDFYKALAEGQQEIVEPFLGPRGNIFLYDKKNLEIVATNKSWYLCYADPSKIENPKRSAKILGEIFKIPEGEILGKLQKREKLFVVLKRRVTEKEVEKLKKVNLKGVYLQKERHRYYPFGNLASDILGFVDVNGRGRYGIEGHFNDILSGKRGWIKKEFGIFHFSQSFEDRDFEGGDIVLTIDKNIQLKAQELLLKAKNDFEIEGGQIIVVEPKTGKILALADLPTFDPNNYSQVKDFSVFKNGAIQSLFEPGSMFKPITMAIGLEEGRITPDTKYIDKGYAKVGGRIIYNYNKKKWGKRTMKEVLQYSINTGAIFVESLIGDELFLKYVKRLGFFEPTDVELEGEIFSKNLQLRKGYKANFATASFGQGINLTPLNFVRGFSALINGGKVLKMHIVSEIRENGKMIKKFHPEIIRENVFSEKTQKNIIEMLINVVENGYGKRAKIKGYWIGGKTGTSQMPWTVLGEKKSGYSQKTWQSFIGFFPAYDPKFVILVKLDNPNTKTSEYSATPLFREMAQYIINYYQLPPDYTLK